MFDKNIYLESLNYIYLSNETIKTKYILNLLHNSLIETYSKLNIKPQNIKASLLTILYQCNKFTIVQQEEYYIFFDNYLYQSSFV